MDGYRRLCAMAHVLKDRFEAGAVQDHKTGEALIATVQAGNAVVGDISRWLPPTQPAYDAGAHINRAPPENPLPSPPVVSELPDPAINAAA
jgi:hypothetical protein